MLGVMPMIGLVQGLQPIAGFNYGARQYDRVKKALFLSIKTASIYLMVFFVVVMVFAEYLVGIFSTDLELISLGTYAIRLIILAYPLVGFQIISGGLYQALGKARPALILSLLRQIIILIPLVIVLPLFLKLNGIWLAFPISDILSAIVTFFMLRHEVKSLDLKHKKMIECKEEILVQ